MVPGTWNAIRYGSTRVVPILPSRIEPIAWIKCARVSFILLPLQVFKTTALSLLSIVKVVSVGRFSVASMCSATAFNKSALATSERG